MIAGLPDVVGLSGLPGRVTRLRGRAARRPAERVGIVDVEVKLEFIRRLVEAGHRLVETTSFVHPSGCRSSPMPRSCCSGCRASPGCATRCWCPTRGAWSGRWRPGSTRSRSSPVPPRPSPSATSTAAWPSRSRCSSRWWPSARERRPAGPGLPVDVLRGPVGGPGTVAAGRRRGRSGGSSPAAARRSPSATPSAPVPPATSTPCSTPASPRPASASSSWPCTSTTPTARPSPTPSPRCWPRRHHRRRVGRRAGRLPVRRVGHRQPRHRGPRLDARRARHRARRRPRRARRDQHVDGRRLGRPVAVAGGAGARRMSACPEAGGTFEVGTGRAVRPPLVRPTVTGERTEGWRGASTTGCGSVSGATSSGGTVPLPGLRPAAGRPAVRTWWRGRPTTSRPPTAGTGTPPAGRPATAGRRAPSAAATRPATAEPVPPVVVGCSCRTGSAAGLPGQHHLAHDQGQDRDQRDRDQEADHAQHGVAGQRADQRGGRADPDRPRPAAGG